MLPPAGEWRIYNLMVAKIFPGIATQDLSDAVRINADLEGINNPIVLACDEEYAMPLATTLRSMIDADSGNRCLEIVVLCSRFSPEARREVLNSLPDGSARIHWLTLNLKRFEKFSTLPHISTITFARLVMPYCFPESTTRALYLDSDILVLDDLAELWRTDLEGKPVAAAVDSHSATNAERIGLEPDLSDVSSSGHYFNAGVLLVDLSKWRAEQISERALDYLTENPQSLMADQDALNIACRGMWKKVDSRWNCLQHPAKGYLAVSPESRPAVIHFAGRGKPWLADSPSMDRAFYDNFRSRTRFARSKGQKVFDFIVHFWTLAKSAARKSGLTPALRRVFALRDAEQSMQTPYSEQAGHKA